MEKCGEGVFDAATDVIALGFELGEGTAKKMPELAARLFQDDAFRKTIHKALLAEGKRLSKQLSEGKSVSNKDGLKVLESVGKSASKSSEKWAEEQIKKSSDYKALQKGIKTLECRFKETPVGVFVDENKGLLIILASGLALGGAVAMYTTRSGDWVASKLAPLASKQLRFKMLGNLELGSKSLVFKPSERQVELTTFITAKWSAVKTTLDLQVGFKEDEFAKTKATGEVVIDVAKGTSLIGKAGIGHIQPANPGEQPLVYDLSVGAKFSGKSDRSNLSLQVKGYITQVPTKQTVGVAGELTYGLTGGRGGTPGLNLKGQVKGGRTRQFMPAGADKIENSFEANLGVELLF
ncbi:MAG TPA: hypothetical protein VJ984_14250 [Xanthomonadales bacterium]|nr:hypothetical protein [Xanthomonadales bacterium]